jgi:hypothetical protein
MVRTSRLPSPGQTQIAHGMEEVSGGKRANQAVAAARLGAEVCMLGCVGNDGFAATLKDNLARENIDTQWIRSVPVRFDDELFHVDLLCPNQSEAEAILGIKIKDIDDARAAAIAFRQRGAKQVVITLGSQGAIVCEGIDNTMPLDSFGCGRCGRHHGGWGCVHRRDGNEAWSWRFIAHCGKVRCLCRCARGHYPWGATFSSEPRGCPRTPRSQSVVVPAPALALVL